VIRPIGHCIRATTSAVDTLHAPPGVTDSIEITVNGAARRVAPGTTVAGLITELGLGGKRIAVERNRDVVPRARHSEVVLQSGDHIELVTFVGGG
jgi:sulfur carrier protein